MRQTFGNYSAMKTIVARVRTVEKMPITNEHVVAYFQMFFADRLCFTERGQKAAIKCDINPEMPWACLFQVAKVLVDLYRSRVRDIEDAYKAYTGWEPAPAEGSKTREISDMMSQRKDIYDCRKISVEPHIKPPKSARKTGAQYQRLYYAYDPETRKAVVGCVGDHLENYLVFLLNAKPRKDMSGAELEQLIPWSNNARADCVPAFAKKENETIPNPV